MRILPLLLATASLALPVAAQAEATPPTAPTAPTEAQKLRQIFTDSDEGSLKRNPINALFRGDPRYADRFGDYISDAYNAAEKAAAACAFPCRPPSTWQLTATPPNPRLSWRHDRSSTPDSGRD